VFASKPDIQHHVKLAHQVGTEQTTQQRLALRIFNMRIGLQRTMTIIALHRSSHSAGSPVWSSGLYRKLWALPEATDPTACSSEDASASTLSTREAPVLMPVCRSASPVAEGAGVTAVQVKPDSPCSCEHVVH